METDQVVVLALQAISKKVMEVEAQRDKNRAIAIANKVGEMFE